MLARSRSKERERDNANLYCRTLSLSLSLSLSLAPCNELELLIVREPICVCFGYNTGVRITHGQWTRESVRVRAGGNNEGFVKIDRLF